MTSENTHFLTLVKLILPKELFEYFELINLEVIEKQVHVYLEEIDHKPEEYEREKLLMQN